MADNREGQTAAQDFIDKVIEGDCLKILPQIPPETFDMVFLDPPYFLQLPPKKLIRWEVRTIVEGVNEKWDKFASFQEYDELIRKTLEEVKRVMKPKATIWAIGTYHNIHRIGKLMQDLGFWILNDVIWVKTNPMPNWLNVRFTNAVETIIWAVKDKKVKGYTFNRHLARSFEKNKIALSIWHIPICMGRERILGENGKKLHSTQKPEALMERIILVSTNEGDWVLDPMAGTGTTGVVAKRLGRHFTLIEKEPLYIEAINKRLKDVQLKIRQ